MTMSLRIERPNKSLRELAQDAVRQAILDLQFVPGERLVERTLCEQLGVSRTVVREVLRYLEAEGLIEVTPHKGPIVAPIRPDEAEQIYELRALLEGAAAGACAKMASPEDLAELEVAVRQIEQASESRDPMTSLRATAIFYEKMFRIAGKTIALEIVKSFNVRINALRALTISSEGRQSSAAHEMRVLYEAIASGDAARASKVSARHVQNAAKVARQILELAANDEDYLTGRLESVRNGAAV
jgi:DNA-binding GntR family transcriptional regulator